MSDAWTDRLSAALDGELSLEERAAFDAHLESCSVCRADLARLREVRQWAAEYRGTPVHADVWRGVRGAIDARRQVPLPMPRRRVRVPVALAAGLALLVVGAGSWWVGRSTAVVTTAARAAALTPLTPRQTSTALLAAERYGAAIAQLEQALLSEGSQLDTATVRVVRDMLAVIDRAIGEAREALAKDPGSDYLADHFATMMRKKLNLLRSASAARSS
jgi:predicted anti-sigma-YlaC factor YlaD